MKRMMQILFLALGIALISLPAMAKSYGNTTITTSTTTILSSNRGRAGWGIVNNSTTTFYYGFDQNVTSTNGTPLYTNQAITSLGDLYPYRGDIIGVVGSGTADVRYNEYSTGDFQ